MRKICEMTLRAWYTWIMKSAQEAQKVISDAVRSSRSVEQWSLQSLERSEAEAATGSFDRHQTFELSSGRQTVTLRARAEREGSPYETPAGDVRVRAKLEFGLGWSSCGSVPMPEVLVHAALLTEAASLVAAMSAQLGDGIVEYVVYTAEQVAADRARRDLQQLQSSVEQWLELDVMMSRARVGDERESQFAQGGQLTSYVAAHCQKTGAPLAFTVTCGRREFAVTATGAGATVKRTK